MVNQVKRFTIFVCKINKKVVNELLISEKTVINY